MGFLGFPQKCEVPLRVEMLINVISIIYVIVEGCRFFSLQESMIVKNSVIILNLCLANLFLVVEGHG